MMRHLKEMDEADRTVIMMQVENESGLLGSVRDYTKESNALFEGPVPEKLVTALKKKPGSWTEVFGGGRGRGFHGLLSFQLYQRGGARRQAGLPAADLCELLERRPRYGRSVGFLRPAGRNLSERRSGVAHAGFVESGGARNRHPLSGHHQAAVGELPHDQLPLHSAG